MRFLQPMVTENIPTSTCRYFRTEIAEDNFGRTGINITDAIKDWAFRPVFAQSSTKTNYQVSDNSLLFQPQKATPDANGKEPDEVVWMVSQNINPRSVEPDKGTAIQSIETRLNKYSYSYRKPGTYTATFVAKNANMWESKTTVRQITIVVQQP